MIKPKTEFNPKAVTYIPALGLKALTPIFDPFLKWSAREATFKPKLVEQTRVKKSSKVLDLGCGTGTLDIFLKKKQPEAEIVGLDIDPDILRIARQKTAKEGLAIRFELGSAFNLLYEDEHFDIVVSSLMFHHLTRYDKIRALREACRVLKTGGELHIADLGKPQNALMRAPSAIMRHLEESEDNFRGWLLNMIKAAGFEEVMETDRVMTMFGTVSLYSARKTDAMKAVASSLPFMIFPDSNCPSFHLT